MSRGCAREHSMCPAPGTSTLLERWKDAVQDGGDTLQVPRPKAWPPQGMSKHTRGHGTHGRTCPPHSALQAAGPLPVAAAQPPAPRSPHHDGDAILLQRGLVVGHFTHSHHSGGPVLLQVLAGREEGEGGTGLGLQGSGVGTPLTRVPRAGLYPTQ